MKIDLSPLELHKYLESKIPHFEDADLYHDTHNTMYQVHEDLIKKQIKEGFNSIDDMQEHEACSTIIDLKR